MKTCKEVSHIVATEKELTLKEKLELKFHLLICKVCRHYVRQMSGLKKGLHLYVKKSHNLSPEKTKQFKERMIEKIINSSKEN